MLALVASLALADSAPYAFPDPGAKATVHTLENGLTVVLLEDHRTDTVALHLRYAVGSRDEVDGTHGCAHLFEHLMFEGSKNVGPNEFDTWLTGAGGDNNAYTSEDETAYHMTFPSGTSELALFLESDRMGWLLDAMVSDKESIPNQQDVVLQERAEGYAAPHGRDWDALTSLIFPAGHPYHVPVIGTIADIRGFDEQRVSEFWKASYRPNNAVLVLVGNFESAATLDRITAWFGEVPRAEVRTRSTPIPLAAHSANGMLEDDVSGRTVYLAWPTVALGDPDEPALDLLGYLLSGGRGTRLDDRLYYDSKLADDDNAYAVEQEIGGFFTIYATAPKKPLPKLVKAIDGVLADLAKTPPTAAELDRARRSLRSDFLNGTELPADRAETLAECMYRKGRPDCMADEWARYEAVTPADISRVVAKWLPTDTRITLSVVPRGDTGALPGAVPVELP